MKPCKSANFFVKSNVLVIAGGCKILPPERVYDPCLFLIIGKKRIDKQISELFSRFNLQFTFIENIYTGFYFIIMKILTDFRNALISGHPGGLTPETYGGIARDLLTFFADFWLGKGALDRFCTSEARYKGNCNIAAILKMKDPHCVDRLQKWRRRKR